MSKKLAERLKQIRDRGGMQRTATVVREAIDVEARTVELSFSSETEMVERWFGIEILGHDTGEVDLSRLNNGAPVLWMHNGRDQRGVVESARVDGDRIGRAKVRFSKSDAGEQLFQDILDDIVTKVSVGYDIGGIKLVEERDGVDVYRITQWTPSEISMVSVPADDDVGVGRSREIPQEEVPANSDDKGAPNSILPETRNARLMEKIVRDSQGNLVRAKVDDTGAILEVLEVIEQAGADVRSAQATTLEGERARIRALTQLGTEYSAADLASEHIRDGKTADQLRAAILTDFATKRAKTGAPMGEGVESDNIGLTGKEVRSYSMMRAVRALMNPHDKASQDAAAFEIECSVAAQRQYGKEAKGILIPGDILAGDRAFNAGGAPATTPGAQSGANLVGTTLMSGSFIEALRNRTTIMQLGQVMGGLVGNVDVPKQTGISSAYWVGEGEDASETNPSLGQISLTPKTVAAFTDITRRLAMQSSPDAEALVNRDLNTALAQAIDFAGYYGKGTDKQPMGLANYVGINTVNFTTAGKPTFAEIVQMETEIAADNADVGSMAYVGNAKLRGHAKTALKFASAGSATMWEPGNTMNGYRTEITNQVADGDAFFGNFSDFIIAMWGGLDLTVDPYSLSKSGGIRLVVFQDVDFILRRLESICLGRKTS